MGCDLLDWGCIFISEIAGGTFIAILLALVLYFVAASRLNWGFLTTVSLLIPIILIMGMAIGGYSAIMAFVTIIGGLMLAWMFNKLIGNR